MFPAVQAPPGPAGTRLAGQGGREGALGEGWDSHRKVTEAASGGHATGPVTSPGAGEQTPSPGGCFGGWPKGKPFFPRGTAFPGQAPCQPPGPAEGGEERQSPPHGQSGAAGTAGIPRIPGRWARLWGGCRGFPERCRGPAPPRHPPRPRAAGTAPRRLRVFPGAAGSFPRRRRLQGTVPSRGSRCRLLALPGAPRARRGRAGTALGPPPRSAPAPPAAASAAPESGRLRAGPATISVQLRHRDPHSSGFSPASPLCLEQTAGPTALGGGHGRAVLLPSREGRVPAAAPPLLLPAFTASCAGSGSQLSWQLWE